METPVIPAKDRWIVMGRVSLRLPESLHELARDLASQENNSINQLITLALAENISALTTEKYFLERAEKSSRAQFEKAMSKIARDKPVEYDRLSKRNERN